MGDAVDDPLAKSRGVGVVAFRADGLAPSHLVAGPPERAVDFGGGAHEPGIFVDKVEQARIDVGLEPGEALLVELDESGRFDEFLEHCVEPDCAVVGTQSVAVARSFHEVERGVEVPYRAEFPETVVAKPFLMEV